MSKTKRQRSDSPASSATRKRPRPTSSGTSDQRVSRATSVFRGDLDPYFPQGNGSQSSLPTAEDWRFRLKILCSEDHVSDDIRKEAVQGLVRICFPEDILDELGINVVTQHMHEEGATDDKISRMREAFRYEMVHRVSWMFANYLDTTDKVERGIASAVAATNRMHGNKLDGAVLDDIIKAFQALKSYLEEDSQTISRGGGIIISAPDMDVSGTVAPSREQLVGAVPSPEKDHTEHQDIEVMSASRDEISRKKPRVSKTWRWAIDLSRFTADMIPLYFQRRADLFAYHALPVVQNELGPQASKDEIRLRMDELWAEMGTAQRKKWQESFAKLQSRDMDMLNRVAVSQVSEGSGDATVPSKVANTGTGHVREHSPDSSRKATVHIKVEQPIEGGSSAGPAAADQEEGSVVDATAGSVETPSTHNTDDSYSKQQLDLNPPHHTPIVNLLRGTALFSRHSRRDVMKGLVEGFEGRCLQDVQTIDCFDKKVKRLHRHGLKSRIGTALGEHNARFKVEGVFRLWVASCIASFPELMAEPFVFVYIEQNVTPVVDLFCPSTIVINKSNGDEVIKMIQSAMRVRGIDMDCKISEVSIGRAIHNAVKGNVDSGWKRLFLERALRWVVVRHKETFPELKRSTLVKRWEARTGQVW
ncbi:hypothetical protein K491DRAFT_760620 [Lophiostoma macrostomum CBS 122681]|uniref:Uncharacterized protein n=1 Tax=Lophiostoma macrostomum CBS 122681 TaxID=1314788 RepID=A0A6A6SWI0_9PLEO|nr:hypothetical protein K491DRAFT_760620 [Lophiostoma macrostomum CBS 122681]